MSDLSDKAREIRKRAITMVYNANSAHLGSIMSAIDILTVLYFRIMSVNPDDPLNDKRDRFILSKGHAVAALYATLSLSGYFKEEILGEYCKDGSKLAGHSTMGCVPGVEASTGSLGHGLPMAAGMALAGKRDKKDFRVFTLMSDGECQEGSNWEAALFASHHKLDNLVAIIDYNKIQALGRTNEVLNLEPFVKKWEDFGWGVKEVDGHNLEEIEQSLLKIPFIKDKPSLLIAHTIKGKGISFLEDTLLSHYKVLNKEEYERTIKELEK
jgi:transketolase